MTKSVSLKVAMLPFINDQDPKNPQIPVGVWGEAPATFGFSAFKQQIWTFKAVYFEKMCYFKCPNF